jgi:hypothetical protein
VREGRWVMGARSYPSLLVISLAIIDSREKPWLYWRYRDVNGHVATVGKLHNIPPELDKTDKQEVAKPATKGNRIKMS